MAKKISEEVYSAKSKIKMSKTDKVLVGFFYLFVAAFAIICLLPIILVVSASFTDELALSKYGYGLWPSQFSLDAYKAVMVTADISKAYLVTIFITVVGVVLSMLFTSAVAYTMSVKNFRSRTPLAFFLYFTMLFNGGLVSSYLLITQTLKLQNTIWVLIIPSICNAWNIFLMRNFFSSIPDSLAESAKIDGANDVTILFRIILPISLPAIATIGLFYALAYWNEWNKCMLYIDYNHKDLYTLQYLIQKILREIQFLQSMPTDLVGLIGVDLPTYSFRMATVVVVTGPIILLYPFLQKYFVQGLTVGAIKG